jgi:hypothetical protein
VSVVKLRLAVRAGESLQCAGTSLESCEKRILAKICESQVHVIGVVKRIGRDDAALEIIDEFPIVHGYRRCLTSFAHCDSPGSGGIDGEISDFIHAVQQVNRDC